MCTVTARIEPLRGGRPHRRRGWSGTEDGWPRWNSLLHGEGWTADWTSFRPPSDTGGGHVPVELRGHLCSDFGALTSGQVRGVIRRLWTVHSRRGVAFDPWRMQTWPPAWGSTVLTSVDELPMVRFGQPWPALLPGMNYTGLLAELDLAAFATDPEGGRPCGPITGAGATDASPRRPSGPG